MPRENAENKARRYLAEGRLIVHHVDQHAAHATCRGDGTTYRLAYSRGRWQCDCPARTRCAHLYALGLVIDTTTNERNAT